MKKKIVSLCLVIALLATAITGATLAYFTDADADRNVMVAGNVVIVQNETQRDGSAYEDEQALLPAVYYDENGNPYNPTTTWEGPKTAPNGGDNTFTGPDGKDMKMYDKSLHGEIDKVISVTNGGTLPAYIRTIILIENTEDNALCALVHTNENKPHNLNWLVDGEGKEIQVTIEDTIYSIAVCNYADPLAAGETSAPSLKQVWLDPSADNEWYELLGEDGRLSIIAFSQAVQTDGFDNAQQALNTAFGEVTGENVLTWLAETPIKTTGFNNVVPNA